MWQRPLILVIIILALSISVNSLNISQTIDTTANNQLIRNGWNGTGTNAQWYGQTFIIPTSDGANVTLNYITLVLQETLACTGNVGVNVTHINNNISNMSKNQIAVSMIDCSNISSKKNITFHFNTTSIESNTNLLFGIFNNGTANSVDVYGSNTNAYVNGSCVAKLDGEANQRSNCFGINPTYDLAFFLDYNGSSPSNNLTITAYNNETNANISNFTANVTNGSITLNYITTNGSITTNITNGTWNITIFNMTEQGGFYQKTITQDVSTNTTARIGTNTYFNITANYTNYITYNNTNYTRNLTITLNYRCPSFATTNLTRMINSTPQFNETITCTNLTQTLTTSYVHSQEGNYTINYTFNTDYVPTLNNKSTNTQTFSSDLNNPTISVLTFDTPTNPFNSTSATTLNFQCYDIIAPVLNYTLDFNNVNYYTNVTLTNNTLRTNTSSLVNGDNNLTGVCADWFGSTSDTYSLEVFIKTIILIDEIDNVAFNVSNLTSARVYFDDNSTYFDFKANNTNTINYTSANNSKLRFELIPETGTTITRWIDTELIPETTLRVCANKQGVTHFEQLIISATEKPALLKSVYSQCYVAADYTRFAYQNAKVLKAFTIQTLYYLNTLDDDGNQILLASVDGSIQTFIDIDQLEFLATPYDLNIIQSSLSFSKTGTTEVSIRYENVKNNNANGTLTITNLEDNSIVLTTTSFTNPNNWTLIYDWSTLPNVTNSTTFKIEYTTESDEGIVSTLKRYFTGRGNAGMFRNEISAILAVLLLLFGITLTSAKITFGWFGIIINLAVFGILTLALGGEWYIIFLQAINAVILIYIVLNLIQQNPDTIT